MSVARSDIWDWWLYILGEDQRVELMANYEPPLRPDLALELWRTTALHLLGPTVWSTTKEPVKWRLAPEIAHFVANRDYEHRHPDMDYMGG